MTHDEMIAVIQAQRDGKGIQAKSYLAGAYWHDISYSGFDFGNYEYRVKPEPRYFWIVAPKDGVERCDTLLANANQFDCPRAQGGWIKVCEVLD